MKSRVSIVRCKSYDSAKVKAAVSRAFALLGGLSLFVKKGEKILLKPNILSGRLPEAGVNTHIEIIRAVATLVKECGGIPFVADNPGGSISPMRAYKESGLFEMAGKEDIECLEVKNVKVVSGIPIASYFFECDKIISLPKMKTHSLMGITGAVKNMYGAVSGVSKSHYHKEFPSPDKFVNVLIDVFKAVTPQIVLMDGIVAMEGDGPAAGKLRNTGLLLASEDSVAMDSVFSYLIGIDPLNIATTREAYKKGLGKTAREDIEVLGERIEDNLIKNFRLPSSRLFLKLPSGFVNTLAALVKFGPYIDEKLCVKCMICQKTCPVAAITVDDKRSIIDTNKCIKCMCCHEVCPHGAVSLKRNILAKLLGL